MKSIEEKIIKISNMYGDVLIKISANDQALIEPEINKELENLGDDILDHFLAYPGHIFEFDSESDLKLVNTVLKICWQIIIDSESYSDSIHLTTHLTGPFDDILERLQLINPIKLLKNKISYTLSFKIFYNEAMKAWLMGLNNSSIILCAAIIEEAVESLLNIELGDIHSEFTFGQLINKSKNIIVNDENIYKKMEDLNSSRRNCLHLLIDISSKEALKEIESTKKIIEYLYA